MDVPKLKICRVNDLDSAKMLVWQGVEFIGMHIITTSELYQINNYKTINRFLQNNLDFQGSVLVTRIKELDILKNIIDECNFKFIQLHVSILTTELILIREFCNRKSIKLILVFDPLQNNSFEKYYKYSDILIIDHIIGGTGNELIESSFHKYKLDKCLIAGGINNLNIKAKAMNLSPFGFDVQSYTETKDKLKDFEKVNFLMEIISPERFRIDISKETKILSLSLTDLEHNLFDSKILPIFSKFDCFHIDHATGTLNNNFIRNSLQIVEILNIKAKSKPYDLHLFAKLDDVITIIDDYLSINFRLHIAYIHVETIENDFETFLFKLNEECLSRRIKLGIAIQAGMIDISKLEHFIQLLHNFNISEISIVGLSINKSLTEHKRAVIPLAKELNRINILHDHFFSIALDRETTIEKAASISMYGINKIFAGKSILQNDNPERVISKFNKILGKYYE